MKPKGLSKDAGWMVGARRTFSIYPGEAWKMILSEAGIRVWLGDLPGFKPAKGATYRMADGTHGEVTVFSPGSHMRLTWQPTGYPRASIIQVRVIPSGDKAAIAFHQEQLPDAAARAGRGEHFRQALEKILDLIEKLAR